MYVFAKFSRAWMFLWVRKGFRLATLPHSPDSMKDVGDVTVVTCSTQPALGLLDTCLNSFLLIFLSVFEGRPILGNVTVLHF